ncbi:MAG: hypothetical protein AB7Q29_09320 [Vicinamibacterales bacterium]
MRFFRAGWIRGAVLAAAFLLLMLLFAHLGPLRIIALLAELGASFPVVVLLFACHECTRAAALSRCFHDGERPPFAQLLRVRLLGEALGTLTRTGAFAAEPARVVLLAGQTGLGAGAYAAALAELVANSSVSAGVTLLVAGFVLVSGMPGAAEPLKGPLLALTQVLWWGSLVYLSAVAVALTTAVRPVSAVARGIARLATRASCARKNDGGAGRLRSIEDAVLVILARRSRARVQLVLFECLAQSILIVEIYWIVAAMGVRTRLGGALFLEVLMKAPNLVQFMGVTEAGYAVIFNWFGVTAAVGFALSLVKLLRTVVVAGVGLGLLNRLARIAPAFLVRAPDPCPRVVTPTSSSRYLDASP